MKNKRNILEFQEALLNEQTSSHLSIDDLFNILTKTIFDAFYVWSIPMGIYYYTAAINGLFIKSLIFALFIDIFHGLSRLQARNNRLANPLIKNDDIVVITGASSNLGKYLSAILSTKSYGHVINLDITDSGHFNSPLISFIQCDVSDYNQVVKAYDEIKQTYGTPTILINNAGIVHKGPFVDMDVQSIEKVVSVNILGVFWTIKTFLPDMIRQNRGHIVTISSVLGKIGPADVACYSASKSALVTFHDSLSHELNDYDGIGTLLVLPGQMHGPMFDDVRTPSIFIAPILDPRDVAISISEALEKGTTGQLSMPLYAKLIGLTGILPTAVIEFVRKVYGMDESIRREKRCKND